MDPEPAHDRYVTEEDEESAHVRAASLVWVSARDYLWLLGRPSCADALRNLECATDQELWPVERARAGRACPRFERCVWRTSGGRAVTWSGTVPAGPPTRAFLDGLLLGIRPAEG